MARILLTLALAASALPVSGQVRPVVDPVNVVPATGSTLPDHKIVANDLISVSVYGEPGLSRIGRVFADGTILMPKLNGPIRVEGLWPREVEAQITRDLVDEQLLVHPLVAVSIVEYASKMISVVGDVKVPGQFTITGPITLLEAMAKSGWTTSDAGPDLLFTRSANEAPKKINIEELQRTADPAVNVTLTGGELINVPDAPKVWVTGNVTHPQAVPVRKPGDATVLKLVASAEGLTQYYNKVAYIYRPDPGDGGKRREIAVPLKAIMHRKAQDVQLFADDILLIPDDNGNTRRSILQSLQALGGAGASAAIVTGMR